MFVTFAGHSRFGYRREVAFDLPIRCQCGHFRAVARDTSPKTANRVSCSCKFCQSYVRHLGRAEEILDDTGGTEVIQLRPSRIELLAGQDRLGCLHLSETGARRFYARCCRTPIANTPARLRVPFVGIFAYAVDHEDLPRPFDEIVGPLLTRVNGDFTGREKELKATRGDFIGMVMHLGPLLTYWWLAGDHRRSPFFGPDGRPVVEPERIRIRDTATSG